MVHNLYKLERLNVLIPQEVKCLNTPHLYTTDALYNSSINVGSISFCSSSDKHQSHHLFGCHATGINYSFNSFLRALRFSNLICQDKKAVLI